MSHEDEIEHVAPGDIFDDLESNDGGLSDERVEPLSGLMFHSEVFPVPPPVIRSVPEVEKIEEE
jgi:hypothetical protein